MLSPAILSPYTTTAPSTAATLPVSFSGTDSSSSSFSSIATQCLLTPSRSTAVTLPSSAITVRPRKTRAFSVRASSSSMIEKETPESERPHTFLRESDNEPLSVVDSNSTASSVRARFEKMIREAQDRVCAAIEEVDGGGKFKEDVWSRPGGGGGISRVLQDGAIWEKAGVNVSVVYGVMPPEAYRAAKPVNADANSSSSMEKPGPVPFFAAGISSICKMNVFASKKAERSILACGLLSLME